MAFNLVKVIGDVFSKTGAEIIVYTKDSPKAPRISSDYEMRTSADRAFAFAHMWSPDISEGKSRKEYTNIFDQTFTIVSTLDVSLNVRLSPIELTQGLSEIGNAYLYTLQVGEIPAKSDSNPKVMVLTPEASDPTTPIMEGRIVIQVPELRQPFPAFYINIKPNGVPTSGEVRILNCRRY